MNDFAVTIKKANEITLEDGTSFRTLSLEQLVPTLSKTTGKVNLYPMRASITIGEDLESAQAMVGKELSGKLVKVALPKEKFRVWKSPAGKEYNITTQIVWSPDAE